jgi:hypothetical protein
MSSSTQTSSAAIEGRLWSVRADDGAGIQERQVAPAYRITNVFRYVVGTPRT